MNTFDSFRRLRGIMSQVLIMAKQTIDTYKLTSLEEPSDEILSQLMREVAEEAKRKGEEANRRFFENMMAQAKVEIQEWNRRYSL